MSLNFTSFCIQILKKTVANAAFSLAAWIGPISKGMKIYLNFGLLVQHFSIFNFDFLSNRINRLLETHQFRFFRGNFFLKIYI